MTCPEPRGSRQDREESSRQICDYCASEPCRRRRFDSRGATTPSGGTQSSARPSSLQVQIFDRKFRTPENHPRRGYSITVSILARLVGSSARLGGLDDAGVQFFIPCPPEARGEVGFVEVALPLGGWGRKSASCRQTESPRRPRRLPHTPVNSSAIHTPSACNVAPSNGSFALRTHLGDLIP